MSSYNPLLRADSSVTAITTVGSGVTIVADATGELKSLVAGTGISITGSTTAVTITNTGTTNLTDASGVGETLIKTATGVLKTLVAGTGVTLTSAADTITVNSSNATIPSITDPGYTTGATVGSIIYGPSNVSTGPVMTLRQVEISGGGLALGMPDDSRLTIQNTGMLLVSSVGATGVSLVANAFPPEAYMKTLVAGSGITLVDSGAPDWEIEIVNSFTPGTTIDVSATGASGTPLFTGANPQTTTAVNFKTLYSSDGSVTINDSLGVLDLIVAGSGGVGIASIANVFAPGAGEASLINSGGGPTAVLKLVHSLDAGLVVSQDASYVHLENGMTVTPTGGLGESPLLGSYPTYQIKSITGAGGIAVSSDATAITIDGSSLVTYDLVTQGASGSAAAAGTKAIALGDQSNAPGNYGIAIGQLAITSSGADSIAIGHAAQARQQNIVIGAAAEAINGATVGCVVIGEAAQAGNVAFSNASYSIVIGRNSGSLGQRNVIIGNDCDATSNTDGSVVVASYNGQSTADHAHIFGSGDPGSFTPLTNATTSSILFGTLGIPSLHLLTATSTVSPNHFLTSKTFLSVGSGNTDQTVSVDAFIQGGMIFMPAGIITTARNWLLPSATVLLNRFGGASLGYLTTGQRWMVYFANKDTGNSMVINPGVGATGSGSMIVQQNTLAFYYVEITNGATGAYQVTRMFAINSINP